MMNNKYALAFIFFILLLSGRSFAADPYCGDDVCSAGESCDNCKWDCGVCDDEEEGSSGRHIGVAPPKKTVSIFNGEGYFNYPIDSSTYTKSGENATTVRLRMKNPYAFSTGAFRLRLEAAASWFYPKNFTFMLDPDGYAQNVWPYWDVYSLEPNESIEIAFIVDQKIGSAGLINARAEPLSRWGECAYFVPGISGNATAVSAYLSSLNQTEDVTLYFEQKKENASLVLALVGSDFGVFRINNSNVSVVSDNSTIEKLVSDFIAANTPEPTVDASEPYDILEKSEEVKRGPQDRCFQITGMDQYRCIDRESCFYSCFSVPVCSYIATGWEFIDTVQDYRKTIDAADSSLNRSLDSAYSFNIAPSFDSASVALEGMLDLNKAETKVVYHPLFTVYNFCPPADYAIPQQIEARRLLLDYLDENCLYGKEAEIINQSKQLAARLGAIEGMMGEGNETLINITVVPPANLTMNETNISEGQEQMMDQEKEDCCLFGVCSIAGIERTGGVCWDAWAAILFLLLVIIAIVFRIRKIEKERH